MKELRDQLDTLKVTHEKTNQTLTDTQQRLDTTDAGKYYLQCMWQLLQAMIKQQILLNFIQGYNVTSLTIMQGIIDMNRNGNFCKGT